MQKKLTIAVTALSLLSATTAMADQLTDCSERVAACERVIDAASVALDRERDYSKLLEEQSQRQQRALQETFKELEREQRWYNDTTIVGPLSFSLGIALGALMIRGR